MTCAGVSVPAMVTGELFEPDKSNSTDLPAANATAALLETHRPLVNQLADAASQVLDALPRQTKSALEIGASGGGNISAPMKKPGCGGWL